jgi:hypothetical protein
MNNVLFLMCVILGIVNSVIFGSGVHYTKGTLWILKSFVFTLFLTFLSGIPLYLWIQIHLWRKKFDNPRDKVRFQHLLYIPFYGGILYYLEVMRKDWEKYG